MRSKTRSAALAVLCAGVLTFAAACGSDDSSDESGGDTTITWWHNSNNEPGKGYYEQVAKDFEADHPGVNIEISAMAHEDMVDKLDAGVPERRHPRHLHGARRRRARRPRRGRPGPRPLRRRRRRDRQDRRLGRRLAGRRQDLRAAVLPRRGGRLVQHRPLRAGRHHRTADHDGRVVRRHRQAQGRRHHADLGRRRRQVAGRALLVLHRAARRAPRTSSRTPSPASTSPTRASCKAGEVLEDLLGDRAVQQGLPDHPGPGGRDLRLRPARHRQGRDGDAGPLGARRHAGPHRRRQGPRRQDRLVPVPGGRGRPGRPDRRARRRRRLGGLARRRPTRRSTS